MRFSLPPIKCSAAPLSFRLCCLNCTRRFDLITARSAAVGSREEPPNIWLAAAKNAFVGWALNFRVRMLLKSAVKHEFESVLQLASQHKRLISKLRMVFPFNVSDMAWAVSTVTIYLIRDHMEADLPRVSQLDHQIWTMTLPSLGPTVYLELCFWTCCCLFEFDTRSCDAVHNRLSRRSLRLRCYPISLFCRMSEGRPRDYLFSVACFSRWKRLPS